VSISYDLLALLIADKVSAKQVAALTPSLKDITRANDVLGFWTCSAKEGYNFEKSIHALVTKILEQRFSDEIKFVLSFTTGQCINPN